VARFSWAVLLVVAGNDCKAQETAILLSGIRPQPLSASDSVPVHSLKPEDTFIGPDKVKHFFMSAFVESVGFGGMEAVGASRGAAIGAATVVAAGAGVGREVHDKITKNLFSLGDLVWDALGIASALLLISHT
jgi:hypothetical protein